MNILVHIDRLVLEGFELAPAQRRHLQVALQAELGDLLSSGGLRGEFASGIAVPSVQAEAINDPGSADPARLGRRIARAVYSGIGSTVPATTRTISQLGGK